MVTITNRLEAIHMMAEIRRMELRDDGATEAGRRLWSSMLDACSAVFSGRADADIWEAFYNR